MWIVQYISTFRTQRFFHNCLRPHTQYFVHSYASHTPRRHQVTSHNASHITHHTRHDLIPNQTSLPNMALPLPQSSPVPPPPQVQHQSEQPALSSLIFPTSHPTLSLSNTLSSLKRSALSITNRLQSITSDSKFVCDVADAYGLPLVANERCGSWYIPPKRKRESVYFKSTDGHTGEWGFSTRRVNLWILKVVGEGG